MLGSLFIVAVILLTWIDELMAGALFPDWLSGIAPGLEALPAGLLIFPALLALVILAAIELTAMLRARGTTASAPMTALSAVLGLVGAAAGLVGGAPTLAAMAAPTAALIALVAALRFYSRGERIEGVTAAAAGAMLAFTYLGVLAAFLMAIRWEFSAWILLGAVLVTKSCDIGAYFVGMSIGRRKLIPWLSPGKTWEGLIGGALFSAACGAGAATLSHRVGLPLLWWQGALSGLALGLAGQAGDLVESLLKRDAGLKDSSCLLPGFGGVLDIVDSPLLAAPVAFWLLILFQL